ncbi:class I SAM-dependent methyltransferase [Halopseudomonas oceani]|uniref:class I SAM-dependent methyltransferase n=1 Tax=Halopseudomonas oceani TaxID=1708783 RepID=UPI002AA76CB2|nr:class I SAM-dependent methyltransferase [Halopseudomonas oceani]
MTDSLESLEHIAQSYHLSDEVPDRFIESACQHYCCDWIAGHLQGAESVLELGYGDGITLSRLSPLVPSYRVIEGAKSLAERVRREHPKVEVLHQLFEEHQSAQPYDRVLALHVLEHVDDPVSLLRHMANWMGPDSEMIVVVPNSESLHRRLAVLMGLQPELDTLSARDKVVGHQRVYDLAGLIADLEAGGFEVIESKGFFLKTLPNSMMLEYSEGLIAGLNALSEQLPAQLLANLAVRVRLASASDG